MKKEAKIINRFKPVQADLRTLANENATTTQKRKPIQNGSHSFMAFAKKKTIHRFKSVQTDLKILAHDNATRT